MCMSLMIIVPNDLCAAFRAIIDAHNDKARARSASPRLLLLSEGALPSMKDGVLVDYTIMHLDAGVFDFFCSCSLYSDPDDDGSPEFKPEHEKVRARGQRKGWSNAKIERAVEDSLTASPPAEPWWGLCATVREIIAESLPPQRRIGLFVQNLSSDEKPTIKRVREAPLSQLINDDRTLLLDELVWVNRQ